MKFRRYLFYSTEYRKEDEMHSYNLLITCFCFDGCFISFELTRVLRRCKCLNNLFLNLINSFTLLRNIAFFVLSTWWVFEWTSVRKIIVEIEFSNDLLVIFKLIQLAATFPLVLSLLEKWVDIISFRFSLWHFLGWWEFFRELEKSKLSFRDSRYSWGSHVLYLGKNTLRKELSARKYAAYHYYIDRLISIPFSTSNFSKEVEIIKNT